MKSMQQEDIIIVFSFYYMDALGLSSGEQTDVIQKSRYSRSHDQVLEHLEKKDALTNDIHGPSGYLSNSEERDDCCSSLSVYIYEGA